MARLKRPFASGDAVKTLTLIEGYGVGVAAERCDIALDPLQSRNLIQNAVIAGRFVRRFLR
jgi:hypothetical protein